MKKDDLVYFGHMLDKAYKVVERIKGKEYQEFFDDELLRTSLVYWLQVIGEAAHHLSDTAQEIYPNIPLKRIIGMRHRIVHDYLNVDYEIVWKVATEELSTLILELEKIVHTD